MPVPAKTKPGGGDLARTPEPQRELVGYEFRALLPVLICVGLLLLLSLVVLWLPLHSQLATDPSPVIRAIVTAQLYRVELWLGALLAVSASLGSLVALFQARRMAASVKRLREGLAKLAVGETAPLTFERGGGFRALEAPFAGVVSRLDELTRGRLEMLRFLRYNLEGLAQRAEDQHLSGKELHESIAVLLRDVDSEVKKLQMKA